jgi:hypothetical protein
VENVKSFKKKFIGTYRFRFLTKFLSLLSHRAFSSHPIILLVSETVTKRTMQQSTEHAQRAGQYNSKPSKQFAKTNYTSAKSERKQAES